MPRMRRGKTHPKYEALARGDNTYMKPADWSGCAKCGGREFYVSNSCCVHCARNRPEAKRHNMPSGLTEIGKRQRAADIAAKKTARENGVAVYNRSHECPTCHLHGITSYARYVRNGGCVECQKRRSKTDYKIRAGYVASPTLPIVPAAATCIHGELLRKVLPELEGQTLRLVRHWWAEGTMESPHYGKCALCHPDRTVTLRNKMINDGCMPPTLEQAGHWLIRLGMPSVDFPHGILVYCQQEKNRADPRHVPLTAEELLTDETRKAIIKLRLPGDK